MSLSKSLPHHTWGAHTLPPLPPSNTLFPLHSDSNPFYPVLSVMRTELIEHVRWFSEPDPYTEQPRVFARPEGYQQIIVNHAIATLRIARLHQGWGR